MSESCGQGLISLTSESKSLANPGQVQHYLELGEIQAAFRRTKMLKEWTGDLEVRSINQSIDLPLAKDYDAIVELEFDGSLYRIALSTSDLSRRRRVIRKLWRRSRTRSGTTARLYDVFHRPSLPTQGRV